MKKRKAMRFAALFLVLLVWSLVLPAAALGADQNRGSGDKADSLEIKVGYFGGPYYTKKKYSASEMESMAGLKSAYSYIDNRPSVCVDFARGIQLADLINKAGIDDNSVQTFHFYTKDSGEGKYVSFPKTSLLDTTRYYYPKLPYCFTPQDGVGEGAKEGKKIVQTMMAVSDNWTRYNPGDPEIVEDYTPENQSTNTRYRLLFGQVSPDDSAAYQSAMYVHTIQVMLGGSPSLKVESFDHDLKVGSTYQAKATIEADSSIKEFIQKDIKWSSSDESIAVVDKNGNVTIKKEGKVKITATYTMEDDSGNEKVIQDTTTVSGSKQGNPEEETKEDEKQQERGQASNAGSGDSGGTGKDPGGQNGKGTKTIAIGKGTVTADAKALDKSLKKQAGKKGKKAAEQNWRVYEMSETAVEMPEIKKDNQSEGALAGIMGATIFFLGITGKALLFYRQL